MKSEVGPKPSESILRAFAVRLSQLVVVLSLTAGIILRTVALDAVPPGLHHDEACNGYDAYSILLTGRDHHGNFLPIAIEAFGDYRPPIFDYSLVPLIGAFGLKPAVVRLGAALWGSVDLAATIGLAGLMLGWPGAAAAAALGALSPWHLAFSRFGQEAMTGSATATLALLCFFAWLSKRKFGYLILSAVLMGVSLYSYSVVKLFTPLMLGLLTVLYWRELKQAWPKPLIALGVIAIIAIPQIGLTLRHPAEMQARYNQMSLFGYMANCPACTPAVSNDSTLAQVENFTANWAGYFSPSYLFLTGDRGDHWAMLHPQGFGQLLPEQAPLIALSLIGLLGARRRRIVILLLGWLAIAAIPAALTVPSGAWQPESGLPTPFVFIDRPIPNVPLTPGLLYSHPDSRRDALAMTPWILLSAVGFVVLLELTASAAVLTTVVAVVFAAGTIFHGARFLRSYFHDYPNQAAPYFQYGLEQAIAQTQKFGAGRRPVVVTDRVQMPYIYVLFFERYPPDLFQREQVQYVPHTPGSSLYDSVTLFDGFVFGNPQVGYLRFPQGVFVFPGRQTPPEPPVASIQYPDGSTAYNILIK